MLFGVLYCTVCCSGLQSDLPLDEQMSLASIHTEDSLTSLSQVNAVIHSPTFCVCTYVSLCVCVCVLVCMKLCCGIPFTLKDQFLLR